MNETSLNKGLIAFLVLFAIFISLIPSVTRAIWFDESASIFVSLSDVLEIPETVKQNENVGPLHHFLLHYWQKISLSIPWMRLLTAIFFSLSALLIFNITKQRHSKSAAVVAGVIFILNTPQSGLYDIRFYSLSTFLGLLSTYLFLRCVDENKIKNWVMYSISIALCLYQFYFLYFIVIIHALYYFVIKKFKIRRLKKIFFANVFAFILFIPWIPAVIHQFFFKIKGDFWIKKPTLISLLKDYMVLDGVQVVFWVLLVFAFFGFYKAKMSFIVKKKLFFLSLFLFPPIMLFIISCITQPLLYGRYLQVFYPYLFILMGIGYFNMHRKIKMLVGVFLVVLVVVISGKAIIGLNQTDAHHHLQRGCLSLSQEPGSTLVVHNTPHFYFPSRYYLLGKPVNQVLYFSGRFAHFFLPYLLEEGDFIRDLCKITELDYSSVIFFEEPETDELSLYYNSPEFLEIYSYVGYKMFGQIKVTKFNRKSMNSF